MIHVSSLPRVALNTCRCSDMLQAKREKFFVSLSALKPVASSNCARIFWNFGELSVVCWAALRANAGSEPGFPTPSAFDMWLSLFGIRFNSTGERGQREASIKYAELCSLEIPLPKLLSVSFQENITALFIESRLGQIIISCWRWVQRMHCQVSPWISKFGPFFPWCKILICYMGILKCGITYNTGFCPYSKMWMPLPSVYCFNQNNLIITFLGFLHCSWAAQKLLLHCCILLLINANIILRYYIINVVIFWRTEFLAVWNTNTTPKKSLLWYIHWMFFQPETT